MHLFGTRVLKQIGNAQPGGAHAARQLRAVAAAMLTLSACMPSGFAQQAGDVLGAGEKKPEKSASALPSAPAPVLTQPLNLRQTERDFSKPAGRGLGSPINWYRPTTIGEASFANSVRLTNLVKDGKIYLSLSDAIALAVENNYDIAIARYDLDIADTDILRAKSGNLILGAPSGLVTGTLGGSPSILATGGGPGGTTVGSGGAGSGVSGLSLTTNGAGPAPALIDPALTGTIQWDRNRTQTTGPFSPAASTNTSTYNFTYNEGFNPGTALAVSWNNNRATSSSPFSAYFPVYNSTFKATVTQHLLQGAGIWVNKRFLYQAQNDRRITDSSFRQQLLYTVNQVEQIYWGLVQAYEDEQAKQQALEQSTQVDSDTRKQLEIGTMAPLDVVNADSTVATDKQALISSQSVLSYQQLIMKQAITRNLNDPMLESAPIIPTDRISLEEIPEERQPTEDLVQTSFKNRPELEQAVLTLRNDEITLKGARNGLLPLLDIFGYYGSTITGGPLNPNCFVFGNPCFAAGTVSPVPSGYSGVLTDLVNSTAPDKGVGFNLTVPLRNREAQSAQARSLMEYRQAELRLEQLYTQIRMQVVNAQSALTNDRALVQADDAAVKYNQQSLDAEQKKLKLGASTTANVLLQERNLAVAEDNLIAAHAAYANARAALYQITATTLQHYGINLQDAAVGTVGTSPSVPGLQPAPSGGAPATAPPASR
ncbi:MAG: TolC family protein [Acidobacteriota bacterium]|nr:TolC family protein [Acidobacteriota bacterium]